MRAVKTSKPTALSVFITSGQDTIGKKLEKMDFCLKLNFQGAPVQPCPHKSPAAVNSTFLTFDPDCSTCKTATAEEDLSQKEASSLSQPE